MPGRIVLYGATGYTGALTAQALIADGARPVLAGRDQSRLTALAARLGQAGDGTGQFCWSPWRSRPVGVMLPALLVNALAL